METKLKNYQWPGNVRELKNIAKRFIIFGEFDFDNNEIIAEDNEKDEKISGSTAFLDLKEIDRYVEQKVISMLEEQGMSKNDIAKMLGISRSSLWNKINLTKDMSKK